MSDIRLVKKDSSDKLENIKFGISAAGVQKIEAEAKNYINTLQKYSDKVDRQEYFSSEDLKGYKAAMDGYINSNNRLRRLNKSFGKGYTEEEEKTWNDSVTSLESGYKQLTDYFSKFKDKKEYKEAIRAREDYQKMLSTDTVALQGEIDTLEGYYVKVKELHDKVKVYTRQKNNWERRSNGLKTDGGYGVKLNAVKSELDALLSKLGYSSFDALETDLIDK